MECLLGLCFKDFAIIASDQTNARSILVMKEDYDKTLKLSDNLLLGVCGESGDTTQFAEFIEKNVQLYKIQNGYELSPHAAASFTRRNLADYLRSRTPFSVNLLIAGYDKGSDECKFYALDYLGAKVETKFSAHGYGGFFSMALMDQKYRDDMTKDEAYDLIKDCVYEIQKRLVINMPRFQVKVVEKSGITKLPDITVQARA